MLRAVSHFLTLVFIEKSTPRKEEVVRRLMAPLVDPDLRGDSRCDGFAPAVGGAFGDVIAQAVRDVSEVVQISGSVTAVLSQQVGWIERLPDESDDAWKDRLHGVVAGHSNHLAFALDCHR
jgi:hypothetical protein